MTVFSISYLPTGTYTANGSEFKIVLREQKKFKLPTGQFYDVVVGNHYFLNKEAALKNESLSKTEDKFVLFGIPALSDSGGLDMTFRDEINHKATFVTVSFVGGNVKALHWLLKSENETITINAKEKTLRGISVPTDIILKKVR